MNSEYEKDVTMLSRLLAKMLDEHRRLDTQICSLQYEEGRDRLCLQRMKRRKLFLKDRIQKVRNLMMPDIIA